MRKISNLLLAAVCLISLEAVAQRGQCGLIHDHQEILASQVAEYNKLGPVETRGAADVFIPINFTLVAKTDGSGRADRSMVLNQMARLNRDYAETGFQFYLNKIEDMDELNSNVIYDSPGSDGSTLNGIKDGNAMNVFVTNDASTGNALGGLTLGYYTPQFDFVVCIIQELRDTTNTLSHEAGHFFSLPHTHRGWDSVACNWRDIDGDDQSEWDETFHGNPLRSGTSPGGVPVELANGNNCATAGDLICDTPADYNFGFSNPSNCRFTRGQMDHTGEVVVPQEVNQMGYFSDCPSYLFTPMQQTIMIQNYNSSARNYLRSTYVPISDELVGVAEIITPEHREELEVYDDIFMDWEDVEGATHYLIEMFANDIGYDEYFIVTESQMTIDQLEKDTRFNYRIYPFNEGNFDFEAPPLRRFTTGSLSTSVEDVSDIEHINIYPSPLTSGQDLHLAVEVTNTFDASVKITSLGGKVLFEEARRFTTGSNNTVLNTENLSIGLYIVSIETPEGVSQKKVVVR